MLYFNSSNRYYQFLFERVDLEKNESDAPGAPCFKSTRRRDIWVKADAEYNAMERFQEEDVSDGLLLYFQKHHFPVMAYITLYDSRGRECKWLKGGSYTAKIHYGSMLPGQKMDILSDYTHEELVEMLCESYNELSTGVIGGYLHKDLDFRTRSLAEPIISREEYILRTENVNEALQKSKKESVKATIVKDENGDSVIELVYLSGGIHIPDYNTKENLQHGSAMLEAFLGTCEMIAVTR